MRIFLAIVVVLLASCGDTVSSNYDSLAAARADDIFTRGWLPDILPASTRNIRTDNNLDVNISTGSFEFSAKDSNLLYRSLAAGAPEASKFANWKSTKNDYAARGFTSWSYQSDGSTWVFFCRASEARCDYFMW